METAAITISLLAREQEAHDFFSKKRPVEPNSGMFVNASRVHSGAFSHGARRLSVVALKGREGHGRPCPSLGSGGRKLGFMRRDT